VSHPAAPPPGPPAAVPPGPPHPVADRPGASPVDAVIADITAGAEGLGGIHELELVDAAARFDALHAQLQDALSDLDRN
jgi:ABC-type transporter Mla subunit MlaD